VTSWSELNRDAVEAEKHNLRHPEAEKRVPYVTRKLSGAEGPFIAVSDYMRSVPDLISRWVPGDYTSLGTDGFGHSDTRGALRRHFNVDAESVTVAALQQLAARGEVKPELAAQAAAKYQITDPTAAEAGEAGGDS
jgi:pyruvate dehydrogenase E1 component